MKKELKIIISLYENKKEHLKKIKKIVVMNFYWILYILIFLIYFIICDKTTLFMKLLLFL